MKFLITGGSGFLGINLIRYLLKRKHEVHVVDIAPFDYPEAGKIKFTKCDIRDFTALDGAMNGIDIVVHTAAALPLYKKEEIYSTEVGGTINVLTAALNNKVKRVIHISSTAVYGIPKTCPKFESDPLEGVGDYGKAKIDAEAQCLVFRKKGLCVPVLRPKSFIGPERLGVFAIYYDWIKTGHGVPIVGDGNNIYQLLDVEDLCQAIYLCATRDIGAVNDTFNIGAKEYGTMKDDFGYVLEKAGFGKKIVPLPVGPLIFALRTLEALHLSPLYKWVYETAHVDSAVSIEKAQKQLGFKPKFSNKQALLRNYEWYLANYAEFSNKSGVSHRVPWKQGVLSVAKMFF
jgi:nucleoside-diphosphate-sugar epimerase